MFKLLFSNRHIVLILLLIAYILSFIDRNIMAILVGPIREDFSISDEQYAWLNGVAFTFTYVILGIPIAWLADRKSRKVIIASGVSFWSIMTVICGLATGFNSFFAARMGVGVGEAALSPPAHSLLAYYFDQKRLPTIMAIFTLGIPIGIGISYSLGGWVYGWLAELPSIYLPVLGILKPWQATFMVVGLPGVIIAFFIALTKEPQRKSYGTKPANTSTHITNTPWTIRETCHYLFTEYKVYSTLLLAIASLSIVGYSFMMWFVAHASRVYGIAEFEIGKSFGLLYLFFGVLGTIFGAWLSARYNKRGHKESGVLVILTIACLWLIPAVIAPHMPTLFSAYCLSALCIFCLNGHFGISVATIQIVTPNTIRAQVSALLLLCTSFSGLAIGPVIVGFLSSRIFDGDTSLAYALSTVAVIFMPVAIICSWLALKPYRLLLSKVQA